MHLCQQTTIDVYVYTANYAQNPVFHTHAVCICVGGLHLPHINVSPPAQEHLPTPLHSILSTPCHGLLIQDSGNVYDGRYLATILC